MFKKGDAVFLQDDTALIGSARLAKVLATHEDNVSIIIKSKAGKEEIISLVPRYKLKRIGVWQKCNRHKNNEMNG